MANYLEKFFKGLISLIFILLFFISNWGYTGIKVFGKLSIFIPINEVDPNLKLQNNANPIFNIIVKQDNFTKELLHVGNGIFEIELPEGVYELELRTNTKNRLDYIRANIKVYSGEVTEIRILPFEGNLFCSKKGLTNVIPLYGDSKEEEKYSKPKYDKFSTNSKNNVVFQYCQKKTIKDKLVYSFATATYKNITIYAKKIEFNQKGLVIKAEKDATSKIGFEVGFCRKIISQVVLKLDNTKLLKPSCKGNVRRKN